MFVSRVTCLTGPILIKFEVYLVMYIITQKAKTKYCVYTIWLKCSHWEFEVIVPVPRFPSNTGLGVIWHESEDADHISKWVKIISTEFCLVLEVCSSNQSCKLHAKED